MIGRRALFGIPLAGLVGEAAPITKSRSDVLFRFSEMPKLYFGKPDVGGRPLCGGAFLFSEVAGYSKAASDCFDMWMINLKGAGWAHTLDQPTFERFEREYVAWHG
jgi:hypothetical protein